MENDILLARSGVRWLLGVCGFRFSSKIFKLRISFCAQCVCGLSILCGVRRHVCLCGVAGQSSHSVAGVRVWRERVQRERAGRRKYVSFTCSQRYRVRLRGAETSLRVIAISSRSMVSLFLAWSCFFGDTVGCFCLGWNISGLVRKRVWGRTTVKCVGRMSTSLGISASADFVTRMAFSCREKSRSSDCRCRLVDAPW